MKPTTEIPRPALELMGRKHCGSLARTWHYYNINLALLWNPIPLLLHYSALHYVYTIYFSRLSLVGMRLTDKLNTKVLCTLPGKSSQSICHRLSQYHVNIVPELILQKLHLKCNVYGKKNVNNNLREKCSPGSGFEPESPPGFESWSWREFFSLKLLIYDIPDGYSES